MLTFQNAVSRVRFNAILLFLAAGVAPAQEMTSDRPFILAPLPVSPKDWHVSAGLTLVTPPRDLTEEVALRVPAFDLHALYGLPSNFFLDGRVISQVVQNHFSAGGRWAHPMGKFSFSLGYDVAWWFGFLEVEGFDSKASGWLNYPSVTLGYDLGDVYLLVKTEAILNLFYRSYVGDEEISTDINKFSGMAFTFAVEQPFYKNTHLTLGLRGTYTKFHWQTWALFSTFDRYLFYPEIIVGFML
jgi:hypothetical protein